MKPRFVLIPLVALIAILAIGAFVVAGKIDQYRPRVQSELESKLNRQVSIGRLSLKIIPLSIRVEGLTIGESPAFPTARSFATANDVYVSAGLLSLIRGNPEVNDIILDKPRIEVVRNAAGVWNYSTLGASGGSSGGGQQSQFSLAKLQINDGQV